MKSTHLRMLLMAGLFLLVSSSTVFADKILFQEDFENDSLENWVPILGIWNVLDGKTCIEECPT